MLTGLKAPTFKSRARSTSTPTRACGLMRPFARAAQVGSPSPLLRVTRVTITPLRGHDHAAAVREQDVAVDPGLDIGGFWSVSNQSLRISSFAGHPLPGQDLLLLPRCGCGSGLACGCRPCQ